MAYFGKEFSLVKQEKFDELVNKFEIPQELKDKIINNKSSAKITKNDDGSYTLTSNSLKGPKETKFTPGVETDETLLDALKVKSVFSVAGDVVTQVLKAGDNELVIKRAFSDTELVVTITYNGYSGEAKRFYKA